MTLYATPDALHAIASMIESDWGSYGYVITDLVSHSLRVTVATVRSADGGEFFVLADAWGNTRWTLTREKVAEKVEELRRIGTLAGRGTALDNTNVV